MDNIISSIDINRWIFGEEVGYQIEGWYVARDGSPAEIEVVDDSGEALCFEKKIREREDVIAALQGIRFKESPGFGLYITNLGKYANNDGKLNINIVTEHERVNIFNILFRDLFVEYKDRIDAIYSNIDLTYVKKNKLYIHGWVNDPTKEEVVSLESATGEKLPCKVKRVARTDVVKQFELKDIDKEYGYEIAVNLADIKTRKIQVHISSSFYDQCTIVDVKKVKFYSTDIGKYIKYLGPGRFEDNLEYYKEQGIRHLRYKLIMEMNRGVNEYDIYCGDHKLTEKEILKQRSSRFKVNPKFSIVIPLFNTPIEYLKVIVDSILNQTYGNLQLCLADGSTKDEVEQFIKEHYHSEARISYKRLEVNGGISENTNAALEMADGDYIMLSDHDDIVELNALYEMVKAINDNPAIDIIYTDEDKVDMDGKIFYDPFFKPDFNLDLIRSNNYICHIFVVKKSIVDKIGKFRSQYDGAQDYDFILRCCEQAGCIHHIPKILYHWRSHPASTAGNPESKMYAYEAGKNALAAHYERLGISAKVSMTEYFGRYRTQYTIEGNPLISIIIPNKDHKEDLERCIDSIYEKSTYRNFEIIICENNSAEKETFVYYKKLEQQYDNIQIVTWKDTFNYSAINNYAVTFAKGEYLILLNNDIEVIAEQWMEEMLGYCQRGDVGVVGGRLYYKSDVVQHAGIVVGMGKAGTAGHIFYRLPRKQFSYAGKVESTQDLSAVTAACMMTKKSLYEEIGGMDEKLEIALNDVDYCLKVRQAGKLVVYNAFVEMYHYESVSRGSDKEDKKNVARYEKESQIFRKRWKSVLKKGDPYYNPNLTLRRPDCTYR